MEKSDGEVFYSNVFAEFFKIYLPDICSPIMRIPPDFIEKFEGKIPTVVALRRTEMMTWQVDLKKIDEHWCLEEGWPQFVKDNLVEDGDFLTFIYSGNSLFFVKIFGRNGCIKRLGEDDESINNNHQSSHSTVNSNPKDVLIRSISPENKCARKNKCKNPCFSQILMRSYYKKALMNIPMKFWREFMGKHIKGSKTVTLQVKNNSWVVGLLDVGERVLLSRGWIKFAKDNSLRAGNECTFELIDTTDLVFNVTFNKSRT